MIYVVIGLIVLVVVLGLAAWWLYSMIAGGADAVSEVLRIAKDQIAPPPATVAGLGQEYLTGLVKLEHRLLILLDINKILGQDEVAALEATTAGL